MQMHQTHVRYEPIINKNLCFHMEVSALELEHLGVKNYTSPCSNFPLTKVKLKSNSCQKGVGKRRKEIVASFMESIHFKGSRGR